MSTLVFLLLGWAQPVFAAQIVDGDVIRVSFSDNGAWGHDGQGLQVLSTDWRDITWPGSPWNQITIAYETSSSSEVYGFNTDGAYVGMDAPPLIIESDLSSGSTNQVSYLYVMPDLVLTMTQTWDDADAFMSVRFNAVAAGSEDISNLRVVHGVDADPDYDVSFDFTTRNDTIAEGRLVISEGPDTGGSLAYGVCDVVSQEVGHGSWITDADTEFRDDEGAIGDSTMHWRHVEPNIASETSVDFGFVVVWAESSEGADSLYESSQERACAGVGPDPLDLTDPWPGEAGGMNLFDVSGALAGEEVFLLYGRPGSTSVPGCTGVELSLSRIRVLGSGPADSLGNVSFDIDIPAEASGRTGYFQAVGIESCIVSDASATDFPL